MTIIETSSDLRSNKPLQMYLHEVGRYDLLTKEEEFELARRIRRGDKESLDKLVNSNLRFVVSVANKFLNRGVEYLDLIAEGNDGLITAAKRFDERRGFRFISYAVWWIRQAIQKKIYETQVIYLPINRVQQARQANKIKQKLEQSKRGEVSDEEICEEMGITISSMKKVSIAMIARGVSIDYTLHDKDRPLKEILPDSEPLPGEDLMEEQLKEKLYIAMGDLSNRENTIISKYYGLIGNPMSLEEIGLEMDLCRERIRQIRNKALEKLRSSGISMGLQDYIEPRNNGNLRGDKEKLSFLKPKERHIPDWSVVVYESLDSIIDVLKEHADEGTEAFLSEAYYARTGGTLDDMIDFVNNEIYALPTTRRAAYLVVTGLVDNDDAYSFEEAAEILNCDVNTVKRRYNLAVKKLKKKLDIREKREAA